MGVRRRPVTGEMPGMGKIGRGQILGLRGENRENPRMEIGGDGNWGKRGWRQDQDPENDRGGGG